MAESIGVDANVLVLCCCFDVGTGSKERGLTKHLQAGQSDEGWAFRTDGLL